jgi:hypothetical protein
MGHGKRKTCGGDLGTASTVNVGPGFPFSEVTATVNYLFSILGWGTAEE